MKEVDLYLRLKGKKDLIFSVEVKTWAERYWSDLGRCLAAKQLETISKRAVCVIWCTLEEDGNGAVTVKLRGWSTITYIRKSPRRRTGGEGMRQIENYQVDENKLRPLSYLLAKLGEGEGE